MMARDGRRIGSIWMLASRSIVGTLANVASFAQGLEVLDHGVTPKTPGLNVVDVKLSCVWRGTASPAPKPISLEYQEPQTPTDVATCPAFHLVRCAAWSGAGPFAAATNASRTERHVPNWRRY